MGTDELVLIGGTAGATAGHWLAALLGCTAGHRWAELVGGTAGHRSSGH
ncbi:unnamed protein product [Staurois parvus]|uniref:Uncharacterized protein n=1 Tax=Staurois parvus TaxID=386267 RepID=A0ABN9D967_9NEOB|nr:unnamed protein product [Staurois parvus]